MARKGPFYPDTRQEQLNLNKRWMEVLSRPSTGGGSGVHRWADLGIPEPMFTAWGQAIQKADAALTAAILSGLRVGPLHTAVQETFAELEKQARNLKRRFFFSPPLSREEMDEMGISERDSVRTPAPVAQRAPVVLGSNPEKHVIRITIEAPPADGEDFRQFTRVIRIGILPRDGKIPERSPHSEWYILKVPVLPIDLPKQLQANRKNETIPLSAVESGSTAYVSSCYLNSKGQEGPWSGIVEIVIT